MENIHSTVAERIVNCDPEPMPNRHQDNVLFRGSITAEDLFAGLDVDEAESAIADLLRGSNPAGDSYLKWVGTALPYPPSEEYLATKHEVTHCPGAKYTFYFLKENVENILELADVIDLPVLDPSSSAEVKEGVVKGMRTLFEIWEIAGGGVAEISNAVIRKDGAAVIPYLLKVRPERPLLFEYRPDTPKKARGTRFLRFDKALYTRIISTLALCRKYGMRPGECHDQDGSWGVFFK